MTAAIAPTPVTPTTTVAPTKRDGLWDARCDRCSWCNRGFKHARAIAAATRHPAACLARHGKHAWATAAAGY